MTASLPTTDISRYYVCAAASLAFDENLSEVFGLVDMLHMCLAVVSPPCVQCMVGSPICRVQI